MKSSDKSNTDLYTNNDLYGDVFMHLPTATAIISDTAQLIALNSGFEDLFQLSEDGVTLPVSANDIYSSFWKKQDFQAYLHSLIENKAEQAEKVFDWQHEDGFLRYIEVKSQLLTFNKSLLLLSFYDVSAVKQVEKEHNERIRHMMHELRNPLSNISLCVELLADSTKENNQEDTDMFLTKASTSVQRMKQIINDLNTVKKTS